MVEYIELLIRIQNQVIQCRQLAEEISDPETSQMLRTLADETERQARKIDAMVRPPQLAASFMGPIDPGPFRNGESY
jgi:hypothetical protein